jgi:redox-sensitive bicupin YhaK (pirin superfamily)
MVFRSLPENHLTLNGLVHRGPIKFNPSKDESVHLLQIWIQPDAKGLKPRYAEESFKDAAPGVLHLVTSKSGRD